MLATICSWLLGAACLACGIALPTLVSTSPTGLARLTGGEECKVGCQAHADVDTVHWGGGSTCVFQVDTFWTIDKQNGSCHCQGNGIDDYCVKLTDKDCLAIAYFRFTLGGNAIACPGGGGNPIGPGGTGDTDVYSSGYLACNDDSTTAWDGQDWYVHCNGNCNGQYDYRVSVTVSCLGCSHTNDCTGDY